MSLIVTAVRMVKMLKFTVKGHWTQLQETPTKRKEMTYSAANLLCPNAKLYTKIPLWNLMVLTIAMVNSMHAPLGSHKHHHHLREKELLLTQHLQCLRTTKFAWQLKHHSKQTLEKVRKKVQQQWYGRQEQSVSEEQTRVAQEMVLKTQWRVQLVNERWQLAKLCLFDKVETPDKLRVHAFQNAVIVSPSIQPGKLVTTIGDGNCFFSCISYALFKNPSYYKLARRYIVKHQREMWSSSALLRKLAFIWYQDVTKKYIGLKSTDINLTVTEYHAGTKMERNGTMYLGWKQWSWGCCWSAADNYSSVVCWQS